nr:MAG TPA: hypothetical protein [Caudoviricetes sp.]
MSENRTITINDEVMNIKDITFDFIGEYCGEHGELDWMEELVDKDTKFIELRNAFLNKFFPEVMATKREKKLTMKDKMKLLREKYN